MAETQLYDVVVIGASVAGATAAATLAAAGHEVLVLDTRAVAELPSRAGCLSATAHPLCETLALGIADLEADPVKSCDFFLADFSKTIKPALPGTALHLVDARSVILALLKSCAGTETARIRDGTRIVQILPAEDHVAAVDQSGQRYRGRFVVLATGPSAGLAEQVGLPRQTSPGTGVWCAEYRVPAGKVPTAGQMDFILGLGSGEGLGYRFPHGSTLTVGAAAAASAHQAINDLIRISQRLVLAGRLPADWQTHAAGTTAWWCPAGAALDTETHIGKRVVAIGDVGGFIAGYTNEFIYPGMWAAHLAAGVLIQALESRQPQDHLREFDSVWRMTMAEYLRAPNTDAQSLLPLIFSNQQMADKMLESLLLGANF